MQPEFTIRTDSFPELQSHRRFQDLKARGYDLRAIPRGIRNLKDNARPEAGAVYGAIDMPWAKLAGQIAQAYGH
jgi:hypothetical protein